MACMLSCASGLWSKDSRLFKVFVACVLLECVYVRKSIFISNIDTKMLPQHACTHAIFLTGTWLKVYTFCDSTRIVELKLLSSGLQDFRAETPVQRCTQSN